MSQSNDSGLNLDHLDAMAPAASIAQHEEIERAVDARYPLQNSPHASVNDKIGAARLAFRNGYRAALANQPAPTVPAQPLLQGRIVSVDVSTCDDDAPNRIFAELTGETGSDGTTLIAIEQSRNFGAHQPAQEQAEPWHDAVLAECMRIEAAYHAGDPERTLKELIDWHANGSDIAVTNKKLADNYLALTCSSTAQQEPVAAPQQGFGQEVTWLVTEIRKPCSMAWRDSLVEKLIELIDPLPDSTPQQAAAPGALANPRLPQQLRNMASGSTGASAQLMREAAVALDRLTASSAPGTPEAPQPPFPISDDEMAALRRFWECATDGEGYDVEKSMMQRLAEMGLVQRKSGAYYMATDFGLYVLGEYTIQRAAQLDCGQEGSAT